MRGNKFHAKGVKTEDGFFHSTGEYRRWQELKLLERGEVISNLRRGERFKLELNGFDLGHFTPDFLYFEKDVWIAEDFKGMVTRDASLRGKLFAALHRDTYTFRITGKGAKR